LRISETETVIKRIVPYLLRRGYDLHSDMSFEEPTDLDTERRKGFIDISMNCGRKNPLFLIEAKRDGTKIYSKHRDQAIEYGASKRCLFVAVTNGQEFELFNVSSGRPLKLNGSAFNRIPSKDDLITSVVPQLKTDPKCENIIISSDRSLPFRPGLSLSKLNHLFKQCHNSIRRIEKNEEHAFTDFSKILFLKLLEEKWDIEGKDPPYTYMFHELASIPAQNSDQIQTAIKSMIQTIKEKTKFGDVLNDPIKLKQDATYRTIVRRLSMVSFIDCDLDVKGAAFEYFVRATLKGKKLGQYFTPRPLVRLMLHLGGQEQIVNNLMRGLPFKCLDPACGTGGFLVFAMNMCIADVEMKLKNNEIHQSLAIDLLGSIKEDTFYGVDAHDGIACSAKMNMIIAGDGHNNIRCADSLKESKFIPAYKDPRDQSKTYDDGKAHLILTNPPFGTSESESLSSEDLGDYEIRSTKGQSLFLQKMMDSVHPDSMIVTVIDDGVLNTSTHSVLRSLLLKECRIESVISLPDETFQPNKINVRSSVLVLRRRGTRDEDLTDQYPIAFMKVESLGYEGSGSILRGFDLERLIKEVGSVKGQQLPNDAISSGNGWHGFSVNSANIIGDRTRRLDLKYWDVSAIKKTETLRKRRGTRTIKEINLIATKRGSSPDSAEYVSEADGYALVVKAGTNISKGGKLVTNGDYIEESYFKGQYGDDEALKDGDVLLASTGEGTMGKCCVYRQRGAAGAMKPAIADGHVTIIRVNQTDVHPEFLCDYLRKGFGAEQINRLYTGSTGLIEIQPECVDEIIVPALPSITEQKNLSEHLRGIEQEIEKKIKQTVDELSEEDAEFNRASTFP
jgi:type I restriction enzyme M protein